MARNVWQLTACVFLLGFLGGRPVAAQVEVTSLADPGTGGCTPQECTLREAIAIDNSTVRHNTAAGDGGGLWNRGTLRLSLSTLSYNSAVHGGGLFSRGVVQLHHSTVSSNGASRRGGGLAVAGPTAVSTALWRGIPLRRGATAPIALPHQPVRSPRRGIIWSAARRAAQWKAHTEFAPSPPPLLPRRWSGLSRRMAGAHGPIALPAEMMYRDFTPFQYYIPFNVVDWQDPCDPDAAQHVGRRLAAQGAVCADTWTGNSSGSVQGISISAAVTWKIDFNSNSGNTIDYYAEGTATYSHPECSVNPSSYPIT
jgi:hypothetical protein